MNIEEIPFNQHLGIRRSGESDSLELPAEPHHLNHLGGVHAAAVFSLAEAASGDFLLRHRGERTDIGGVVRKASVKYIRPGSGTLYSRIATPPQRLRSIIETIDEKRRALFDIEVEIVTGEGETVAKLVFTWFLSGV